jgi:hypothetical protein
VLEIRQERDYIAYKIKKVGQTARLFCYPEIMDPLYDKIAAITSMSVPGSRGWITGNTGLTVLQAYNIDKKVDDGFPYTGRVIAAQNGGYVGLAPGGNGQPQPSPSSPTTCYDNNNVWEAPEMYSMEINNGSGINCALSFQFQ